MADAAAAIAVFDRWYAAHECGDLEGLAAVLAPDVALHSLFRAEPVRGRAAAVAHFARTTTTFAGLRMPIRSGPAAGPDGAVFAEVDFVGTFAGSLTWRGREHAGRGQPFRVPGVAVLHTAGDRVVSVRTLFDRDEWLRQIGVATADAREG